MGHGSYLAAYQGSPLEKMAREVGHFTLVATRQFVTSQRKWPHILKGQTEKELHEFLRWES